MLRKEGMCRLYVQNDYEMDGMHVCTHTHPNSETTASDPGTACTSPGRQGSPRLLEG